MTHSTGRAPDHLPDLIARADQALVRTVDGLADEAYAVDSLLPGWTVGVPTFTLTSRAIAQLSRLAK